MYFIFGALHAHRTSFFRLASQSKGKWKRANGVVIWPLIKVAADARWKDGSSSATLPRTLVEHKVIRSVPNSIASLPLVSTCFYAVMGNVTIEWVSQFCTH